MVRLRPRIPGLRWPGWLIALLLGCGDAAPPGDSLPAPSAALAPPSAAAPIKVIPVAGPEATIDPNPLGLSARALDLAPGARVFAPPAAMLRGAKVGSTLALRATTVQARQGDALVLDGRDGPAYAVHPAYVIPLTGVARPRVEAPVVAEWAGALRHGLVRRYVRDKIVVRFTDSVDRGERQLSPAQIMLAKEGFHPAAHAVVREGDGWEHLLLVSALEGEPRRWLALGYGGASRLVAEDELRAVPTSYTPKVDAAVWVEHLGRMRPAVVKDLDAPGWATVRFERVGRPVSVGWGSIMAPLGPPRPPKP